MNAASKSSEPFEIVTAALPYVNGAPHIGHTVDVVHADALARCSRLLGRPTHYVTGTDENSLKNVRAAEALGVPTAELVAAKAAQFVALDSVLNAAPDGFVRTSADAYHAATASWLFRRCHARGDIYRRAYRGLFCVGCEQFYTESELPNGLCPEHATAPELIEEDNYFFRLSHYAERLRQAIESDAIAILPRERKQEVLSFIRGGLPDFSVSRSRTRARGWGIPVPSDDTQVIFVWFDALGGYLSALTRDGRSGHEVWRQASRRTHVIGKGITRFHALYWPAILWSAELPVPDRICVHGYLTVQGEKISKSRGNAVDPFVVVEAHGPDALRYFLLRHVAPNVDADFDAERYRTVYESELANQLGNLVQRVGGLLTRHAAGVVPVPGPITELEQGLIDAAHACASELSLATCNYDLRRGIAAVWQLVTGTNRYIDRCEPWALARRGDQDRLATVLYTNAEALRVLGIALSPFFPDSAAAIRARVRATHPDPLDAAALRWGQLVPGTVLAEGPPLFPRRSR